MLLLMPNPYLGEIQINKQMYPPVGHCIYCGATDGLTREHVVPHSLGGTGVLQKASCTRCQKVTAGFEEDIANGMFRHLRVVGALPSRSGHADKVDALMRIGEEWTPGQIDAGDVPSVPVPFPVYPPPDIVLGQMGREGVPPKLAVWREFKAVDADERFSRLRDKHATNQIALVVKVRHEAFLRLIAKVAHGMMIARCGTEGISFLLRNIILGSDKRYGRLIGSTPPGPMAFPVGDPPRNHQINYFWRRIGDRYYLGVAIRLFALVNPPQYDAIVGETDKSTVDRLFAPDFPRVHRHRGGRSRRRKRDVLPKE